MKLTANRQEEIEVTHVVIELPVRYGDEDMPFDFPLRDGDTWSAKVNIDTGEIEGWPKGRTGEFYMKVCDSGVYTLLGPDGVVAKVENDYVPHGVIPGQYGDYVSLDIDAAGIITNWPDDPDLSAFIGDHRS